MDECLLASSSYAHHGEVDYYTLEVKIILTDILGDEIGNYRYVEDELGNQIDDYLVLHK